MQRRTPTLPTIPIWNRNAYKASLLPSVPLTDADDDEYDDIDEA